MAIDKKELYELYLKNGENVTVTTKKYCESKGAVYHENLRKKFSKLINEVKRGGLPVKEAFTGTEINHNTDKGTLEIKSIYTSAPTPEDIIRDHKLDLKSWKLSNYWSKQVHGGWRVSALFSKLTEKDTFQKDFEKFLSSYSPKYTSRYPISKDTGRGLQKGTLFLNKQDAHLNKKDEAKGDNDIFERFDNYFSVLESSVSDVTKVADLEKTIYVIGSDHFNSEVTGMTVKGTPQTNILNYHTSFQLICDHEVRIIDYLLSKSGKVEVIYLIGNHDACVSFHMASWLKVYFRDEKRVTVDISPEYTKYLKIYDTAICINHGDVQKPERLAQNFTFEIKDWVSSCNHFLIVTGDRHHDAAKDFGAIKWYQIAASSSAKSSWDKQGGYTTTPALMTSFLIREGEGASMIIKKEL